MMATEENWEEIIRTNYTELLQNISVEFELPGALKKERIFTPIALKSFTDCKDTTEKIDRMLRNLQKKDFESFKKFCNALINSDQEHIVNKYLSKVQDVTCRGFTATDSALDSDLPHYRPVSEGMSECFKQYWNDLIAGVNFDDILLGEIESKKIVTGLQLTKLRDIDAEHKRTEKMLGWLEKGSEKQFCDFCAALIACNQPHLVASYLTPKIQERRIAAPNPPSRPNVVLQPQEVSRIGDGREEICINPIVEAHKVQEGEPIHKDPIRVHHEVRRDPEGGSGLAPVPTQVHVSDITFSVCSQEFLKDFQVRVMREAVYRCESKTRGRALIMNNKFFGVDRLGERLGSDVDTMNLETLFSRLHFSTVVHRDLDAEEILNILKEESEASHHKDYDMFVLFLMSHGIKGEIFGWDGKPVKTADIVEMFNGKNCPTLLGKPKLFFIQSCQGELKTTGVTAGTESDAGMTVCDSAMPDQHHNETMEEMIKKLCMEDDIDMSIPLPRSSEFDSDAVSDDKIHEMADMAMIYATVEGHVAWRRKDSGSLFIHTLIKVLTERAHDTDLIRMVTEAFNRLHRLEVVENDKRYKQIGEKRDTLRREVYLLPPQ